MKKIILTAALVSMGIAAAGSANAQSRAAVTKPAPVAPTQFKIATKPAAAAKPDNTAYAWTAACYAEFGPDATHPDSALLDKCLN